MPVIILTCAICEEDFNNASVIHSTYCGHTFHKRCLEDWKLRSKSCPMCRRDFQQAVFDHELFLNFEDAEEDLEELKIKLRDVKKSNDELQDEIAEVEFKFLQLQEQFTASDQLKTEFEKKIRENVSADENFLNLQRQYTETQATKKDLEKLLQQMILEKEEIDLKCVEISHLKKYSSESSGISSKSDLSQVAVLEKKLKDVGDQLQKEVANSTRLYIEKIKLESYVQTTNKTTTIEDDSMEIPKNLTKCGTISKQKQLPKNIDTENRLIIENIPLGHITSSLKKFIINLGVKMNVTILNEHIYEIGILGKNEYQQLSDNVIALFVIFNGKDMKINFLMNKNALKDNPATSSYIVSSYGENLTSLFAYAKEKLKNNGFVAVYCARKRVFAKRSEKSKPLQIFNTRHVDNLLKLDSRERNSKNSDDKNLQNHKIDENFYQL